MLQAGFAVGEDDDLDAWHRHVALGCGAREQGQINRLTLENRTHFFAIAARLMRQILVDQARRSQADKRGGGLTMVTIEAASPALASALSPLLWYEVLTHIALIALAAWLLVLFGKHRKLAKNVAMVYLLLPILLGIIDLIWASSVSGSFNLSSNESTASWGRSLIAACIWVPYFAVSKRIKATLTE